MYVAKYWEIGLYILIELSAFFWIIHIRLLNRVKGWKQSWFSLVQFTGIMLSAEAIMFSVFGLSKLIQGSSKYF